LSQTAGYVTLLRGFVRPRTADESVPDSRPC
jgi:hypothetical protein